jgi:hypothetical protein
MKRRLLLLLPLLIVVGPPAVSAQKLSHDELVEILEIKSWRVPMPKDENREWSIELVDYAQRKSATLNLERLTTQRKALIVLRDMGNDVYRLH